MDAPTASQKSQNLTSKAVQGVQWTTASTIITSILQIGYTSIMSRLLDPTAFGLVAMAQIILSFGSYFARMGMGEALIQKSDLSKNDIRAVFTSSVLLSGFFAAIIWLLAPFCNILFDKVSEDVVPIVRIMSFNFLIGGLSTTAVSLLTRELKFKQLAVREIFSFVISSGIGVTMSFLGYGVWSLVFAHVSQSFLMMIFVYVSTRHTIMPIVRWKYYKPFFKYGSVISINLFVDFFSVNLPLILIGKFFGDYKLGIYRQAFMIIDLPLAKLALSIRKVVFPMYSMIQNDFVKIKDAYLSSITFMVIILVSLGFCMSVAAKEITLVLLGSKFIESYQILSILALGICFKFLSRFTGIIWDATAHLSTKFYIQSFYLAALVIAFLLFKDYGIVGFAWIVTIGEIVRNFVFILATGKILNVTTKEYFKAYFPGLFVGLTSAAVIYGFTVLMNQFSVHVLFKLIVQMMIGGSILVYLVLINPLPTLRDLIKKRFLRLSFFTSGRGKFFLKHVSWYKV